MANSIFLLDFLDFSRTFSTAVVGFATTEPLITALSQSGLGTLTATLDEVTDIGRLASLTVRLLNQGNIVSTLTGHVLENTRVRLRHGFDNLTEAQYLTVYTGVVDRYTVTWESLELALVPPDIKETVNLSLGIGSGSFPNVPTGDKASKITNIPILLGALTDVLAPPVDTQKFLLGFGVRSVSAVSVAGTALAGSQWSTATVTITELPVTVIHLTFVPGGVVTATVTAGSAVSDNPVDQLLWLLSTFMPLATYDAATFAAAKARLASWHFQAVLTAPGESVLLMGRLARQCRHALFRGIHGEWMLEELHSATATVLPFDDSNIVSNTLQRESAPIDSLYSSITVYYAGTGISGSTSDFAKSVFANPEAASTGSPDLVARCAAAKTAYGIDHRLDFFAEWIYDTATANLLLNYLVQRYTVPHPLLTWKTWLDALPVHIGQRVTVAHPLVPGAVSVEAQVVETQFDSHLLQVELKARVQTPIVDNH